MRQYDHGGDIYGNPGVVIDFSVNTNPLGCPESVKTALISRISEFSRYPDSQCRELRAAIARHENVPEEWVLCGNGAADLIYRLCWAVKPRTAYVPQPAFSEYERALGQVGCQLVDLNNAEIIFLCHPNNPTGQLISEDTLEQLVSKAAENRAVVLVDECFLDFTDGVSAKRYLAGIEGLVVLKAFTKIYAMAGLRLGYVLTANGDLRDRIETAGQCWSVSVPAQIAGLAALGVPDWVRQTKVLVASEREFVSEKLSGMGLNVWPSDANFLLFQSEKPLYEPLLQKGILIRRCGNFKGLDESYYRIGLKTRPDNLRLLEAVEEVLLG